MRTRRRRVRIGSNAAKSERESRGSSAALATDVRQHAQRRLGSLARLMQSSGLGGRRFVVTTGQEYDAGDAQGERDAEGHVGDQRVPLGVVGVLGGRVVVEVALGAQRLDAEDGAYDRAASGDAQSDVGWHLAVLLRGGRGWG